MFKVHKLAIVQSEILLNNVVEVATKFNSFFTGLVEDRRYVPRQSRERITSERHNSTQGERYQQQQYI